MTLAGDDRYRVLYDLSDISLILQKATILYEDQYFYSHQGVDILALVRAFWQTYVQGGRRIGASTITMQVARLRWGIPSSQVSGKLSQILRAIQLSRHYDKKEILEAYLNLAPYGRNIEGVGAASRIYFNKLPSELNLAEALTLSVIPQNPVKRNPASDRGFERLLMARQHLQARWLEYYPKDKEKSYQFELPLNVRSIEQLPFAAPHFIQYLNRDKPTWESGTFHTTIDIRKQQQLEYIVTNYMDKRSGDGIKNASALLLNYETMAIEAWVGSADFSDAEIFGQVDGVRAKRSPGSTLKPFVYGLALDEGLVHPGTMLRDAPKKYAGFAPENYDRKFLGPISAKQALIESRNVPAVILQARLGDNSFHKFLLAAGVRGLKSESHYGLALALGGAELTMLELVRLYALLANGGELRAPQVLRGQQHDSGREHRQLLTPEASFLVLDALKQNPPPDDYVRLVNDELSNDIAWKTGTSWAHRDAWAIAISGKYVLAVWVGNFDGSSNPAFIGRKAAGPLAFASINALVPSQSWSLSEAMDIASLSIKKTPVCLTTGDLPGKYCPQVTSSWFIPGISPIKLSQVYRQIPVDKASGLRACWQDPETTEMKVFEFWPSDFLHIFQQAGISLKTPPKFHSRCSLNITAEHGQVPTIVSPQQHIEYVVQAELDGQQLVPFSATTDPGAATVYWFVDDHFVGQARPNEAYMWPAKPGQFEVKAVDDLGRAATSPFRVGIAR